MPNEVILRLVDSDQFGFELLRLPKGITAINLKGVGFSIGEHSPAWIGQVLRGPFENIAANANVKGASAAPKHVDARKLGISTDLYSVN